MTTHRPTLFAFMIAAGCATTPGAQPRDMSALEHAATAAAHESEAGRHAAQHEHAAGGAQARCVNALTTTGGSEVCWTSVSNPTAAHLAEAERHRRAAADHRAASQVLRAAESRACGGLAEADRDMSPFAHREEIAAVTPFSVDVTSGRLTFPRVVGATVEFRAVPGLTAEWLQRLVDCHLARAAVLGDSMPEMSYCPLTLRGVAARVSSTGTGFAVTVRAEDEATIAEIRRRAERLIPRGTPATTDRP